ncbi:T9SS-dependent M36 family metallopeptidase [Gangjinia marincola]|uniref:T9SS-dependent M36 family metallopeptidase n=1 Tax=Gangjinia marincola TaxID=578463 RepID=A0ABP3XX75_9FLAO
MKKIITLVLLAFLTLSTYAQKDYIPVIETYLQNESKSLNLTESDVDHLVVTNQYYTKSLDVEHVYVQQTVNGIPVFNGVANFAIKNNKVVSFANSFIKNITANVNTSSPALTPQQAVASAASSLNLGNPTGIEIISQGNTRYILDQGNVSLQNITANLVYAPIENNTLKLAWDLFIETTDTKHMWSIRVDALTGEIINKNDLVISCTFESHNHDGVRSTLPSKIKTEKELAFGENSLSILNDGSQYNVFPLPVESPNHGDRALVQEPVDLLASPFGWHDVNGAAGAEFTVTRGNNVWAQEDRNSNNGIGYSPDGTADLNFDFELEFNGPPSSFQDASLVNLFYWNNVIHDVLYQYGFDEASGNFQENNYGNGGNQSDSVNADGQDGSSLNNATFGTPPDGQNPRMSMFLWSASGNPGNSLIINTAGPLQGDYSVVAAGFGGVLPFDDPLIADAVVVIDDNSGVSTDETDACDTILNGDDLTGSIAIIRRGECQFGFKALAAENEGAIAVIVVNNVPGPAQGMSGGDVGDQVTIPVVMIAQAEGEQIITELQGGGTLNMTLFDAGPYQVDGSFDNGIVAHEYGHGLSTRLTGGPANSGCLFNAEQMGEGWSDFLGLILTMDADDFAEQPRGIATYAVSQPITGSGIRPARYSTDFAINSLTYGDTNSAGISQPHGIGTVWASILWDMTWALIDEYGFDADIYNGTGGNNIAFQLVVDALKLQPCGVGFVTGRDAILEADMLSNDGANQLLIWTAFANRGVGENASQGSTNSRFDQVENFDIPAGVLSTASFATGDFGLYPNPAKDQVVIQSGNLNGTATIAIYDINGRIILSQDADLSNDVVLNTSSFSQGIYLVKITAEKGTFSTKLVIE